MPSASCLPASTDLEFRISPKAGRDQESRSRLQSIYFCFIAAEPKLKSLDIRFLTVEAESRQILPFLLFGCFCLEDPTDCFGSNNYVKWVQTIRQNNSIPQHHVHACIVVDRKSWRGCVCRKISRPTNFTVEISAYPSVKSWTNSVRTRYTAIFSRVYDYFY